MPTFDVTLRTETYRAYAVDADSAAAAKAVMETAWDDGIIPQAVVPTGHIVNATPLSTWEAETPAEIYLSGLITDGTAVVNSPVYTYRKARSIVLHDVDGCEYSVVALIPDQMSDEVAVRFADEAMNRVVAEHPDDYTWEQVSNIVAGAGLVTLNGALASTEAI